MPKLSTEDPIIKSLPTIGAYLPDITAMAESSHGLPGIWQMIEASWAFKSDIQWQRSSQVTAAAIATNIGIPVTKVFRDVVEMIGVDVNELVGDAVAQALGALADEAKELLKRTLEEGVGIAVDAMAAIPIIGWVVDLLWDIGTLIKKLVDIVQGQSEEQRRKYPITRFHPQTDADYYNNILLGPVENTKDWTNIFSPPGTRGAAWESPFRLQDLEGGGVRIISSGPIMEQLGCVPGAGYLHQSLEVGARGGSRDAGSFLPTARDQGSWLWKHIQKGELPSMYTIDVDKCRGRWMQYLMDLWESVWFSDIGYSRASDAWDLIAPRANWDQGALMRIAKPRAPDSRLKWQKPDYKFLDLVVPIHELDVLEKRQLGFLNTITCAYVDESFAAIASSQVLKERWKLRRKQLLHNSARCEVSLEDVPDAPYRQALRDAGVGTERCGPGGFKGAGRRPRIPVEFSKLKKLNVPPPLPGLPGSGSESIPAPSRRRPSGILPLAAAAAAAGGLWYLAKRRR